MHLVITGGTGFIGKAVAASARRIAGAKVTALGSKDADLTVLQNAKECLAELNRNDPITNIVHLAALYKAGDWPVRHQGTQFTVNTLINVNALEAWKDICPEARFTAALSYCVYPDADTPHAEGAIYNSEPEDYLFAYAYAKKMTLIGLRAFHREFGITGNAVVLPTVYGPGDSLEENSHVMGALVGKFLRAKESGTPVVEVWGDGHQVRDFIYVEDAADGILATMGADVPMMLNLGSGTGVSIKELVNIIVAETGYGGDVVYNCNKFTGVQSRVLDVELMGSVCGWKPSTSLAEGVSRTILAAQSELSGKQDAATGR